jgi:hypothetical protein
MPNIVIVMIDGRTDDAITRWRFANSKGFR